LFFCSCWRRFQIPNWCLCWVDDRRWIVIPSVSILCVRHYPRRNEWVCCPNHPPTSGELRCPQGHRRWITDCFVL
jgi:hypothetical protein